MATNHGWPHYELIQATKKPILYIGSYKILFNWMCESADGDKTAYFYCINKVKHGYACPSSAKAMVLEEELDIPCWLHPKLVRFLFLFCRLLS